MSSQIASNNSYLLHRKNIHESFPNMRFKQVTWLKLSWPRLRPRKPLPGSGNTNTSQISIFKVSVCLIMITGRTWKKSNICEKFSGLHKQLGTKIVGNFHYLRLMDYYNTPETHYIDQVLDFKPKIHNFLPKSFQCCQLLIATENFSPTKLCGRCPGGSTNEHFRGDYFTFIAANILFKEYKFVLNW